MRPNESKDENRRCGILLGKPLERKIYRKYHQVMNDSFPRVAASKSSIKQCVSE